MSARAVVAMPRLSDSMEEGTIISWMKKVGEAVSVGDELVEIETDKANMVYGAEAEGTLLAILVPEGESAPVGAPIAEIGAADGAPVTDAPSAPESKVETSKSGPAVPPAAIGTDWTPPNAVQRDARRSRVKASPLARRLAAEHGLDLETLRGTGFGGRIVKADVESALRSRSSSSTEAPRAATDGDRPSGRGSHETRVLTKLQRTVARRMSESKATAPHFHLSAEIDMSRAVAARQTLLETLADGSVLPSINDLVVKACAVALREFPLVNASYRGDELEVYERINIGIAVAAEGALLVPTIFDADQKSLSQIATESRSLAARARDGAITPPELSGGTFTVSNLGMYGVDSFEAILNPPQAAILSVGRIVKRPVVRGEQITVGSVMNVTLGCDHRVLSGAEGAQFLQRVRELLGEPLALAL